MSANSITPSARNYLIPNYLPPYEPENSFGQQALHSVGEFASCWWSIFEMLREIDQYGANGKNSLPDWVRQRIGDWRQQHEAYGEMRRHMGDAKRALAMAEGRQSATFEIWTKRGHRLDGQYEYRAQADTALKNLSIHHPDAYVCRVHRSAPRYGYCQPELLDTMIGRIHWAGVSYAPGGNDDDEHTVQDSTGRTVTVSASVLRAHPVFERMTKYGQDQVIVNVRRARNEVSHV